MTRGRLTLTLCLLLGACMIGQPGKQAPLSPDQAKARCERTDGRWGGKQGQTMLCFHTPPDAGKACSKASDCSAGCLAKSRSCAPVTPLIGCQDLLDDDGRVVTQCVN